MYFSDDEEERLAKRKAKDRKRPDDLNGAGSSKHTMDITRNREKHSFNKGHGGNNKGTARGKHTNNFEQTSVKGNNTQRSFQSSKTNNYQHQHQYPVHHHQQQQQQQQQHQQHQQHQQQQHHQYQHQHQQQQYYASPLLTQTNVSAQYHHNLPPPVHQNFSNSSPYNNNLQNSFMPNNVNNYATPYNHPSMHIGPTGIPNSFNTHMIPPPPPPSLLYSTQQNSAVTHNNQNSNSNNNNVDQNSPEQTENNDTVYYHYSG